MYNSRNIIDFVLFGSISFFLKNKNLHKLTDIFLTYTQNQEERSNFIEASRRLIFFIWKRK